MAKNSYITWATGLFDQQLVQADNEENIKALLVVLCKGFPPVVSEIRYNISKKHFIQVNYFIIGLGNGLSAVSAEPLVKSVLSNSQMDAQKRKIEYYEWKKMQMKMSS